ncbi:MAG: hypothetical protein PHU21_00090 [Elusimicrobia bacterium]|jgi:hypothetical protein|nr:hypothetical protein [Elusimicrobiota bacterium]
MHALLTVGLASYSGGFQNSGPVNCFCLFLFWAGSVLLGAALWHLRKAPDIQDAALRPSESPRR